MFGKTAAEFADRMAEPRGSDDPREVLAAAARRFAEFCTSDPARYQLLFQRTLPGFEPSAESYAPAVGALAGLRDLLARNGITEPRHLDMATAVSHHRSHGSTSMTSTTTDVAAIEPLMHDEAMRLQAQELDRTLALLRSLDETAWTAATACPAWDIRAMYQHVLGACEAGASIRENVRQLRKARAHRQQHGGPLEAALSAVQVRARAGLRPAQILQRLTATAPRTIRGRARTPALIRHHASLAVDGPDVVAEWARRHGQPFTLDLTGPAGGTYSHRADFFRSEHMTLDAVDFCRTLAGRGLPTGLLTTVVPF